MPLFGQFFENTCRILKRDHLSVYGISCVDDAEYLRHEVWGEGGMVEHLQSLRRQGRIDAIFCSTHGTADYVANLITSDVFDAIMLAYNPLGFHVLSYYPPPDKEYENLPETERRIFPLAAEHDVSLLIMKPFAGGLLCSSESFPPHKRFTSEAEELDPTDILRTILRHQGVASFAVVASTMQNSCVSSAKACPP